jgi:hypothetical protein
MRWANCTKAAAWLILVSCLKGASLFFLMAKVLLICANTVFIMVAYNIVNAPVPIPYFYFSLFFFVAFYDCSAQGKALWPVML